jgi:hypothetical protein
MSAKKKYEKLVKKWGTELAREIWLKQSIDQDRKKTALRNARDRKFILSGSFESGKKR